MDHSIVVETFPPLRTGARARRRPPHGSSGARRPRGKRRGEMASAGIGQIRTGSAEARRGRQSATRVPAAYPSRPGRRLRPEALCQRPLARFPRGVGPAFRRGLQSETGRRWTRPDGHGKQPRTNIKRFARRRVDGSTGRLCRRYGQPPTCPTEAIAGTTAPGIVQIWL